MNAGRPTKHSLTRSYEGIARSITIRMGIVPFHKGDTIERISGKALIEVEGLFDTGATKSVISENAAKELRLVPVGKCSVGTAGGRVVQSLYMTTFILPNQVVIGGIEVTAAPLPGIDALIGMDIICLGDFAITNVHDNTLFSFQIPSTHRIDFCKD